MTEFTDLFLMLILVSLRPLFKFLSVVDDHIVAVKGVLLQSFYFLIFLLELILVLLGLVRYNTDFTFIILIFLGQINDLLG